MLCRLTRRKTRRPTSMDIFWAQLPGMARSNFRLRKSTSRMFRRRSGNVIPMRWFHGVSHVTRKTKNLSRGTSRQNARCRRRGQSAARPGNRHFRAALFTLCALCASLLCALRSKAVKVLTAKPAERPPIASTSLWLSPPRAAALAPCSCFPETRLPDRNPPQSPLPPVGTHVCLA